MRKTRMTAIGAIKTVFGPINPDELKALTPEDRDELGRLCAAELNVSMRTVPGRPLNGPQPDDGPYIVQHLEPPKVTIHGSMSGRVYPEEAQHLSRSGEMV